MHHKPDFTQTISSLVCSFQRTSVAGSGWGFLHIYHLFHTCLLSKSTLLTKAATGQSVHGNSVEFLQSYSGKLCLDNEMDCKEVNVIAILLHYIKSIVLSFSKVSTI